MNSTLRLVATHLPLHLPVRAFETISNTHRFIYCASTYSIYFSEYYMQRQGDTPEKKRVRVIGCIVCCHHIDHVRGDEQKQSS